MYRYLRALAALLAMQVVVFPASAVTLCAAGNPNTTTLAESTPTSAFTNHGDDTVTHNLTGLMWKRCAQGSSGATCATGAPALLTWSNALAAAVADTTASHTDWRLPNRKELESIVELCGFDPSINKTIFPGSRAFDFWSSSTYAPGPDYAWRVNFLGGTTYLVDKSFTLRAHLVRGGRSFGAFDANYPGVIDIDDNGRADALTDGMLYIRYLFGLRGAALIQGAVAADAQRKTAAEIEAYIQSIVRQ